MPNPAVDKAVQDFEGYLAELNPTCALERVIEIRRMAVVCGDLMNYSYEVADTKAPQWKALDKLVHDVMCQTSHVDGF